MSQCGLNDDERPLTSSWTSAIGQIKPDFDVFALSKLLWTMISGKPRMQLWYWNDPRFDLAVQFPEDAHVARINRIFCIEDNVDLLRFEKLLQDESAFRRAKP